MPGSTRHARRAGAALAAACLALVPACSGSRAARSGPAPGVLEVRRGTFVDTVRLTGRLESVEATEFVVPRLPQWQTTIRWMEADGAQVVKGQKLIELDAATFGRDLQEKRLARDQARADLEQRRAETAATVADKEFQGVQRRIALEKARSDAEVPRDLLRLRDWQERQLAFEKADVDNRKAIEDLETARTAAREEIRQKEIALQKAERDVAQAEQALGEMVLSAPVDGIFVWADNPYESRKFQIGDNVWVGLTIARLPDLRSVKVVADLSDVDDGRVKPGMAATCVLDTYPDLVFPGRVTDVAAVAQEPERGSERRAFRVSVALDRADPDRMRPGMSVRVEIEADRRDDVLLAPRAALDLSGDGSRVRLAGGGTRPVSLDTCNAQDCVVRDGLAEGERLEAVR